MFVKIGCPSETRTRNNAVEKDRLEAMNNERRQPGEIKSARDMLELAVLANNAKLRQCVAVV